MKLSTSFVSCFGFALLAVASLEAQTVTGSGTAGTIPIWTSSSKLGNSIMSQSGTEISVKGTLFGLSTSSDGLIGESSTGAGVSGTSKSGYGVAGSSSTNYGIVGVSVSGVGAFGTSTSSVGVGGNSSSGPGVYGTSKTSYGVEGVSTSSIGVFGKSTSSFGLSGTSSSSSGVSGLSSTHIGVQGMSTSGPGVSGTSASTFGVQGTSTSGVGVAGFSSSTYGVEGTSTSSIGVYGTSTKNRGIQGQSETLAGVAGLSTSGDGIGGISCASCGAAAVFGSGKQAGIFDGNVGVTGTFAVTGVKSFRIDHPLDPANKYLNHFSIESNEVLNSYSGNITTNGSGEATVELPDYFEALNTNYRYQLTVIGQFAQAIVYQEIQNNRFIIRTDKPSVKVSWQVSGVRSDANLKAHPIPVEEEKPDQERGHYLNPEVFGQPEEMSITWLYHGDLKREAKALEQKRQAQGVVAHQASPSVKASGLE